MTELHPLVLKNVRVRPEQVLNDGLGEVRLEATVLTPHDQAQIERVIVDLSSLGGPAEGSLVFQPAEGLARTREGLYTGKVAVPLLADPGLHLLPLLAFDSLGGTGRATAGVQVAYARPPYRESLLAERNQLVFDRVCRVPRVGGNRIEALASGNSAMEKRMSLIRDARTQINLAVYSLDAEGLCGRLLDALLDKAAKGVEVNLLLNLSSQLVISPLTALRVGLHKISTDIQEAARRLEDVFGGRQGLREAFKEIQESFQQGLGRGSLGVNVILVSEEAILGEQAGAEASGRRSQKWLDRMAEDRDHMNRKELGLFSERRTLLRGNLGLPSLPLLTYAVHEKVMVVDGRWAVVGGRNLEDRYFTHWVDMDLFVDGPVVRWIQEDFLLNWNHFARNTKQEYLPQAIFAESPAEDGALQARYVQSRPWLGEYQTMEALVTAFQMARKRILLTSQYLVLPECLLREALIEAAWRGVEVHILTNSHNTGQEVGFAAGHMVTLRYCSVLLEAGIHLYQMIGPEEEEMPKPYLHAKTFMIDGQWVAVGSFNLSVRSCYIESENLLVVQDEAFAAEQESLFWDRLRRHAVELTEPTLRELKEKFRTALAVAGYLDLFF